MISITQNRTSEDMISLVEEILLKSNDALSTSEVVIKESSIRKVYELIDDYVSSHPFEYTKGLSLYEVFFNTLLNEKFGEYLKRDSDEKNTFNVILKHYLEYRIHFREHCYFSREEDLYEEYNKNGLILLSSVRGVFRDLINTSNSYIIGFELIRINE